LPRAHPERLTEKAGSIFKTFQLSKDVSPFVVVGLAPAIHVLAKPPPHQPADARCALSSHLSPHPPSPEGGRASADKSGARGGSGRLRFNL